MGPLGFQEMVVIFVVALLVFGPKKLPELGKSLGKGIREFRKATDDLKQSWEEQVRDVENPVKEVTREIRQVGNDMKSDFYGSDEPARLPADSPTETSPGLTAESATEPQTDRTEPASETPTGSLTESWSETPAEAPDSAASQNSAPESSEPAGVAEPAVPKEHV